MERKLLTELEKWRLSSQRKPLILQGARQVGKTWLLKEFARRSYKNFAYVNFDENPGIKELFSSDLRVDRLLKLLSFETEVTINAHETLLIFDEIQECPRALTSLKYFCEEARDIHVVAAGSMLGLTVYEGSGFPVGKVNMLSLFPMCFEEFLSSSPSGEKLARVIASGDPELLKLYSAQLREELKLYFFVGGMPEVVSHFRKSLRWQDARAVQKEILQGYRFDISKHLNGKDLEHVLAVFESIPQHLAKENRRFIFSKIKESARARDYQEAIVWLTHAGIAVKVPRVTKPGIPLSSYQKQSVFKFFFADVGLLGAMAGLNPASVLAGDTLFNEFKGALTEQFVCQQLQSALDLKPYYWSADNSRGEIDFLVQDKHCVSDSKIIAIEVKAEENLKSKSLKAFKERYPEVSALRFSLSDLRWQDWMGNVPLYAFSNRSFWLKSAQSL